MSKYANWPPEGQSVTKKVSNSRTTYQPLELSDASVYDMAQHYFTLEEIAARFKVTAQTVLDQHGDAYHAGKDNALQKPRILMNRFFQEWMEKERLHDHEMIGLGDGKWTVKHPDFGALIKMMELHAKKYEGLGKDQKVTVDVAPSVSDIKFVPLTAENKDED